MRFDSGWFRIDRNILKNDKQNNPFHGESELLALWLIIIGWANVNDGKTKSVRNDVLVKRGQLLTSAKELGSQVGCSAPMIRRRLDYLVNTERVRLEHVTGGIVLTVLNYDKFQCINNELETDSKQGRNSLETHSKLTRRHSEQVNKKTSKQENNIKESKPTRKPSTKLKSVYVLTESERVLSDRWLKYQQDVQPSTQSTIETIGQDLAKLKRVVEIKTPNGKEKLTDQQLGFVLDFVSSDSFWRSKAASLKTYLKRSTPGGPRKIDNILAQIKQQSVQHQSRSTYIKNPLED